VSYKGSCIQRSITISVSLMSSGSGTNTVSTLMCRDICPPLLTCWRCDSVISNKKTKRSYVGDSVAHIRRNTYSCLIAGAFACEKKQSQVVSILHIDSRP
jgi:hypothetical protein